MRRTASVEPSVWPQGGSRNVWRNPSPRSVASVTREPTVVDHDHVAGGHGQFGLERGHLAALPERRAARRRHPDPVGAVGHDRGPAAVAAQEHDGLVAHKGVAAMTGEARELDEQACQGDPAASAVVPAGGPGVGRITDSIPTTDDEAQAASARKSGIGAKARSSPFLTRGDTRSGASLALPLPEARPRAPLGILELRAQLEFPPLHGDLALVDRLGDQLGQVQHAAASLVGQVGGRDLGRLPAKEARGDDRAGGPGAQAEGHPEQPPHASPFLPPNRPTARRRPAPSEMILTSGLATASSTRPEIRWTRPTISPVASSTTSTRSSSRLVRSTEPLTSRSSGTVSSRIESIRIFVLSSTRNVLISTMHRNRTNRPQKEESTMRATSPPSSAPIIVPASSRRRLGAPRVGSAHHTDGDSPDVPASCSPEAAPSTSASSPSPDGS